MANIDKINLIQAGEYLYGTGREAYGEPDVLNRPLKELVQLMEQGKFDVYSAKVAIELVDNNEFDTDVQNEDVVSMNYVNGKYDLATPDQTTVIGIADLNNSIIHVLGRKAFTGYTFTKGYFYYLSATNPGKIVPQDSAEKSPVVVGVAISTNELFIRLSYDYELLDNSIPITLALGG